MCFAFIAFCLIISIVPSTGSVPIICFIDASLILPPSSILYSNVTFESCRCLLLEEDVHGFQYNNESSSCYTIGNDSSLANLQITNHSRVCFLDPIGTVWECQLNLFFETEELSKTTNRNLNCSIPLSMSQGLPIIRSSHWNVLWVAWYDLHADKWSSCWTSWNQSRSSKNGSKSLKLLRYNVFHC